MKPENLREPDKLMAYVAAGTTKGFVVKGLGVLDMRRALFYWCRRSESNRHEPKAHWILSPARLPISPLRHLFNCLAIALYFH